MTSKLPTTILYIEDDRASQVLVKRVLGSQGYNVIVAKEGLEGITLAKQNLPQLVLMDINLPNMDGREITTRLRSLPHFENTPIVALTANNSPGSRELALAAGCTGFLTKPIDVATFPDEVKKYLQGHQEELSPYEQNRHLKQYAQAVVERLENKVRELEKANRDLETANQRLRDLDKLKSDFIVLVSHELRTPLTLVSGYAHLMEDNLKTAGDFVSTDFIKGLSEGLNKGIARMEEVVNEIINVSRIASGSLDLSMGPVKMGELIQASYKEFAQICNQRTLNLEFHCDDNLPVIEADGKRLKAAIDHVLSNAVKYTPDGGSIKLSLRVLDNAIDITVADTGIGIPLDKQRKIFEQFYTLGDIAHHSTSKSAFQGGGLGLGLAIAKGIIEAHNGRIWVESERRDHHTLPGSVFHILIPIRQVTFSQSLSY